MYTQCDQCLTVYRIQAEALARGHGRFRCGHCGTVFDGLQALVEHLPEGPFQRLPCDDALGVPVVLNLPAMRPQPLPPQPELFQPEAESVAVPGPVHADEWVRAVEQAEARRGQRVRASATPAAGRHGKQVQGGNAWWWAGGFLLLLGLSGQVALAERDRLLADDRVRPWLDRACEALDCRLPLRQTPSAIRLIGREVRPHPDAARALLISASMVNDAPYTQRFPVVEVVLSDLGDRPIAMRRFLPSDYLGETSSEQRGFPSGATAPLVFEVADPGQEAVAFQFRFLALP